MSDITLKQIEIFIKVAESLSFSEAARELFIDPSVVSRWVQRLEANLETLLFLRHNKGIVLTTDGEFFYNVLKPAYVKLDNAISVVKSKKDDDRYVFKIGCLEGEEIISAFEDSVFQFRKLYPNVQLKLEIYDFDELRREFVNENIDFAVCYSTGFGEYGDMKYLILKENPDFIVVSKSCRAIVGGNLCVEALSDEILYLIAPPEMAPAEELILKLCLELGFQPKRIKYVPSVLAIEIAIKNNQGFTIGSDMFRDHFPNDFRLFRIPGSSERIAIFWHAGIDSGFASRFIETLNML
jgi:DNA-binding transcriptional LysR family regulator